MHSPLIKEMTGLRTQLVSGLDALIAKALSDDKTVLRNQFALRMIGESIIMWSDSLYSGPDRRQQNREEFEGFERRGPFTVVFGDINDFKAFNSKHGHDNADFAIIEAGLHLKRIADVCKGEAFRRSGDEFIILLPQDKVTHLQTLLRDTFADCKVAIEDGSDTFSMSFGFCNVERYSTFSELLHRAEIACEISKRSGGGSLVGWTADQEAQLPKSFRERCSGCKTVVALLIPPERQNNSASYSCPVCSTGIMIQTRTGPPNMAEAKPGDLAI